MNEPRRPLRRHRDDDYWDRVEVQSSTGSQLVGYVVPRYKTSSLSGDEWRVHAQMEVRLHPSNKPIFERGFGSMRWLMTFAGIFVMRETPMCMSSPAAKLTVYRKGHVLMTETLPSFGEAVVGMMWHVVSCNEGREGIEWYHLSDAEEAAHCQQVGCAELPINVFHLKKILYGDHPPDTFMVPKYDFEGQFVWYCARHTRRGDCGIEDADKNLELVEGHGAGRPRASDFSESGRVILGDDE